MLEQLGITSAESPFTDPADAWASALLEGEKQGRALVDQLAGGSNDRDRWSSAMHMFDYNLDRLGLGTIDSPDWKIDERQKAYVTRAVVARAGLCGNHGYEANYDSPGSTPTANHSTEHTLRGDVLHEPHRSKRSGR